MDNHTEGGTGGPQKDKFPKGTTAAMIAKLVEEAYKHAEKMGSLQHSWEEGVEHVTQFFQGSAGGQTIQFWFDYTTNTIRTAWPK